MKPQKYLPGDGRAIVYAFEKVSGKHCAGCEVLLHMPEGLLEKGCMILRNLDFPDRKKAIICDFEGVEQDFFRIHTNFYTLFYDNLHNAFPYTII